MQERSLLQTPFREPENQSLLAGTLMVFLPSFIISCAINKNQRRIMTDFFYICRHLVGTQENKGRESAEPGCTRKLMTGTYCTADSESKAAEAKQHCPGADFLKILSFRKNK